MADVSRPDYWKQRYAEGSHRWDLGQPTPALCRVVESGLVPAVGSVAFPGSGSGHDVRWWIERGYDAIGFDFAIQPPGIPTEALDVFELGARYPDAFDIVVEYTCYCAIDPARRAAYATSLRTALRPGGTLVALLFPVEQKPEGPPFGVSEEEIDGVLGAGLEVIHREVPADSVADHAGRERLVLFRRPP